ncbi:MAG TPA: DUF4432 family protein, partial [Capillimicrobium sp.]
MSAAPPAGRAAPQLASAVCSVVEGGPADGCRAIDLRAWDGLDVRLLPDRGLDCGAAWFRGVPLAWISEVGEVPPLARPQGADWAGAFGGGLVTTCGLRNVGAPSEGYGLHGDVSHRRAADVRARRVEHGAGDVELVVTGTVRDGPFALAREWRVRTGTGAVTLRDETTNEGSDAEAAPLLYHVNLGAPLWAPGARVSGRTAGVRPRDADAAPHAERWAFAPEHDPAAPERVFEHELLRADDGHGQLEVEHPALGLRVTVRWDAGPMQRAHQWVHPALGVLGIEPANCSVLGRA